jgi:hypothetical protein
MDMIGVRKDILELNFAECKDTLDKLYAYREAMTVNICQLLYDNDFDCSLFSVISSYGERK